MSFSLSKKSLSRLEGVHSDLVKVVKLAITTTEIDFSVVDGVRTKAKQEQYVKEGLSKTLNSRHITGHAVDLYPWVDGKTSHADEHYALLAEAMFEAASKLNIDIEWGGQWQSFIDKPHWQLPWKYYP